MSPDPPPTPPSPAHVTPPHPPSMRTGHEPRQNTAQHPTLLHSENTSGTTPPSPLAQFPLDNREGHGDLSGHWAEVATSRAVRRGCGRRAGFPGRLQSQPAPNRGG